MNLSGPTRFGGSPRDLKQEMELSVHEFRQLKIRVSNLANPIATHGGLLTKRTEEQEIINVVGLIF